MIERFNSVAIRSSSDKVYGTFSNSTGTEYMFQIATNLLPQDTLTMRIFEATSSEYRLLIAPPGESYIYGLGEREIGKFGLDL